MELGANELAVLIILAVAFWKIRQVLEDLERRASHQLHQSILAPGEAGSQPGAVRGAIDSLNPTSANVDGKLNDGLASRLDDIHLADPTFEVSRFLDSARIVYETVVVAFANGDRELLRDLLAPSVYDAFALDIAGREARAEHAETAFVSLKRADIVDAGIFNGRMQITIAFESELVTATRDSAGVVVAGDPTRVVIVGDLWTFTKDSASRSPVWKLAATESLADSHHEETQQQPVCQLGIA
jgi:predicted lipid-binding transport protein (Tim44 family)